MSRILMLLFLCFTPLKTGISSSSYSTTPILPKISDYRLSKISFDMFHFFFPQGPYFQPKQFSLKAKYHFIQLSFMQMADIIIDYTLYIFNVIGYSFSLLYLPGRSVTPASLSAYQGYRLSCWMAMISLPGRLYISSVDFSKLSLWCYRLQCRMFDLKTMAVISYVVAANAPVH